jgi:pyridoxamine 5'-phosphate oxidase
MKDPRRMQSPTGSRTNRGLDRTDLVDDPIVQLERWLEEAESAGVALPHAMALATADAEGRPSVRHVLLRGLDRRGLDFYTNHESRKGRELAQNPRAGVVFLWKEMDRQVGAEGRVDRLSAEESAEYFATRPREARLGAWASHQSAILGSRDELEARVRELSERFPEDVPLPPFWGGYRLRPDSMEFWQGRVHRLHDRFRYVRQDSRWTVDRLFP